MKITGAPSDRYPARAADGVYLNGGHTAALAPSLQAKTSPARQTGVGDGNVTQALARILRPQAAYRWMLPQVAAMTPQYIEMVLRSALVGDHVRQWELFDLMLDTWPELTACQQELTEGVCRLKLIFEPFAEEDEDATPEAIERQKLVSAALRRMTPAPARDENDLDGTIKDIVSGWFHGVTVLEVGWKTALSKAHGNFIVPSATWWVHPVCVGWDQDGWLGLRTNTGSNLGGMATQGPSASVQPFPEHKFLVGIHKAKAGTALGGALLRPLAWWWCAANFSADWLLNLAQIFGLPFRWANYDPTAPQETVDRICSMLQNMGSAGWAAFPAGTTMELKEAGDGGDHSPQGELLDRADRYARLLILGQTMSGSQDASKGGGKAFGAVESDVKLARIDAAGRYACAVLNTQLIPSILTLNYGDAEEAPRVSLLEDDEGGLEEAQRDQILAQLMPLSASYLRKKYGQPEPQDDEDEVGGAPEAEDNQTTGQSDNRKGKAPKDKGIKAHAARLLAIEDDAVFARELAKLAGALECSYDPEEERDALGRWAGRIKDIAAGAPDALRHAPGSDKVYLHPVYQTAQKQKLVRDRAEFDDKLRRAMRAGHLQLKRQDFPPAETHLAAHSEMQLGHGETAHFILDETEP